MNLSLLQVWPLGRLPPVDHDLGVHPLLPRLLERPHHVVSRNGRRDAVDAIRIRGNSASKYHTGKHFSAKESFRFLAGLGTKIKFVCT
jgi:hypothetical protein